MLLYTDSGNVDVNVNGNSVSVSDSGIGMTKEQLFQVMHENSPPHLPRQWNRIESGQKNYR